MHLSLADTSFEAIVQISAAAYPSANALTPTQQQGTGGAAATGAATIPAATVTLSDAAKKMLALGAAAASPSNAGDAASKAVDSLLASSGSAIYTAAIGSLKQYPPDIATKLDDPTLSDADRLAVGNQLIAREQAAFWHIDTSDGGLAQSKAMIEYYDSLSPAEQNSGRYRGMRENLVRFVHGLEADAGQPKTDYTVSRDPIMILFDSIKKFGFKTSNSDAKAILVKYNSDLGGLAVSKTDPAGTAAKASQASARFTAVQSVVDAARSGNDTALARLQKLAGDAGSIDDFVAYAGSLTPAYATSA